MRAPEIENQATPAAAPSHAARVNESTSPIAEMIASQRMSRWRVDASRCCAPTTSSTIARTRCAPVKLPNRFGSSIVPYAPYALVRCSTALSLTSAPPTSRPTMARPYARIATTPAPIAASAVDRRNVSTSMFVSRKLISRR